MGGDRRRFAATQDLPDFPYAEYAESLGLAGMRMNRPEEIAQPGWEQAFAAKRPVVVEARVDPDVPPLPPHITFEQASLVHEGDHQGRSRQLGHAAPVDARHGRELLPARRMARSVTRDRDARDRVGRARRPTACRPIGPKSDGTLAWDSTTLVTVDVARRRRAAASATRTADAATARLIARSARRRLLDRARRARGRGAPGTRCCARCATSAGRASRRWRSAAVDAALWDLKAQAARAAARDAARQRARRPCPCTAAAASPATRTPSCAAQLRGWVEQGMTRVKMKIGARPGARRRRASARRARRSATASS